jgi:hypothetical protein
MIDDSPKSNPAQLSDEDATFLASLLMGKASTPSAPAVVDLTDSGEIDVDLTDKPQREVAAVGALEGLAKDSPTLTFARDEGMSDILNGSGRGRVSDLVDVAAVLAERPTPEVIARSVFGLPEPGARNLAVRQQAAVVVGGPWALAEVDEPESRGTSLGWFRPGARVPVGASETKDLFAAPRREQVGVVVRLDTAAAGQNTNAVVFSTGKLPDERRRKLLLVALFLAAVALGGGLVALIANGNLLNGDSSNPAPAVAEVVTTQAPATTAAPSTEAPTTQVPTTIAPATTAVPTTATPPTTVAPTTTEAPTTTDAPTTTQAPRTTRRPATTRPPATTSPPTTAPPQTFAPPTWADPLE